MTQCTQSRVAAARCKLASLARPIRKLRCPAECIAEPCAPGASSKIRSELVSRSAHDRHTLLINTLIWGKLS